MAFMQALSLPRNPAYDEAFGHNSTPTCWSTLQAFAIAGKAWNRPCMYGFQSNGYTGPHAAYLLASAFPLFLPEHCPSLLTGCACLSAPSLADHGYRHVCRLTSKRTR